MCQKNRSFKLESEDYFGPDSLIIGIAFTGFNVYVFNACYNVLSKSYISACIEALIAIAINHIRREYAIAACEQGRFKEGRHRTVAVVSVYAPAARLRCFSTAIGQTYEVTTVIAINNSIIAVAEEIAAFQGQIFSDFARYRSFPNLIVTPVISFIVTNCCVNNTNTSFNTCYINAVIIFKECFISIHCIIMISIYIERIAVSPAAACRFKCPADNFNIVAIAEFYTIATGIHYISFNKVLTASFYFNTADRTGNISPV